MFISVLKGNFSLGSLLSFTELLFIAFSQNDFLRLSIFLAEQMQKKTSSPTKSLALFTKSLFSKKK